MTFSAKADSSSAIAVNWNYQDMLGGVVSISSTTIVETLNGDTIATQTFGVGTSVGSTLFSGLKASTTYCFELNAVGEDEYGDTTTIGPLDYCCETMPAAAAGGGEGGGGAQPSAPGPVSDLTANWVEPGYTNIDVNFKWGSDVASVGISFEGPRIYNTKEPYIASASGFKYDNFPPGKYTISVVEYNTAGISSAAKTVTLSPPPGPGELTDLTANWNMDYTAVALSWYEGSGSAITGLKLKRYLGAYSSTATPEATLQIPPDSPYNDVPSTTSQYQYELTATNAFGTSSIVSNLVSAPSAPETPTNVVAAWLTDNTYAQVTWDPVDYVESYQVTLFKVETYSGASPVDIFNVSTNGFSGALVGSNLIGYIFQIVAVNRFGSSDLATSNALGWVGPPPVYGGSGGNSGEGGGEGDQGGPKKTGKI